MSLFHKGYIPPGRFLYEFLTDRQGSREMNVDGAVDPVQFSFKANRKTGDCLLARSCIYMICNSPTASGFGGRPALDKGLAIEAIGKSGEILKTFTGKWVIKTNADFAGLAGADVDFTGGSASMLTIRWTLTLHSGGKKMRLRPGELFRVAVRDDLSSHINTFRWCLQGETARSA